MAYPTITNTFASGATAIHSQWNTNYTDLINGVSAGNKDSQINNLVAAGGLSVAGELYSVAWTDYSAIATIVGWSSYTTKKISYKKIGKMVFVKFDIRGVGSSGTQASFSLPYISWSISYGAITEFYVGELLAYQDGVFSDGAIMLNSDLTVHLWPTFSSYWTPSVDRDALGGFCYEATT